MENYCGNCLHLDKSSKNYWGEYYCNKICKYIDESKESCYQFVKKPEGGYQQSGCYITTIVCDILGYNDDCEVLKLLRTIREDYLKQTPDGIKILQEYDQIGPMISNILQYEPIEVAMIIMNNFLIPCAVEVKINNYEEAVKIYTNMVNELKETYGLTDIQVDYNKQTPLDELGKARIR